MSGLLESAIFKLLKLETLIITHFKKKILFQFLPLVMASVNKAQKLQVAVGRIVFIPNL